LAKTDCQYLITNQRVDTGHAFNHFKMSGPNIKIDFDDDGVEPMDIADNDVESQSQRIRQTRGKMTKYEKARILGARATLLSKGAQPLVKIDGETDLLKIAEKELYANVLPMSITRKLPDGTTEEWRVQELVLPK
jgi:DNA-directed RNA polymerases I, II, and III subunit RPABC2